LPDPSAAQFAPLKDGNRFSVAPEDSGRSSFVRHFSKIGALVHGRNLPPGLQT
jgi:hypothetical protein